MSEPGSLLRSLSGRPSARNFHAFVINEIGGGIVSGRYPVGSTLPSDAEMMASFGVSRTVLREALRTLESKGIVEARPKVGTRVSNRSRWNFFDRQVLAWHFEADMSAEFVAGLFDVRARLEEHATGLAVLQRNAEHIRLLKYWVHQMELAHEDVEAHSLAALEVHRVIVDASGNPLLRSALGLVELTLAVVAVGVPEGGRVAFRRAQTARCNALVEAVEAGQGAAASEAMRELVAFEFGGIPPGAGHRARRP